MHTGASPTTQRLTRRVAPPLAQLARRATLPAGQPRTNGPLVRSASFSALTGGSKTTTVSDTKKSASGKRTYVSASIVAVLKREPILAAILKTGSFQQPSDCITHASKNQREAITLLIEDGKLTRKESTGIKAWLARQFSGQNAGKTVRGGAHGGKAIAELISRHGPAQLTQYGLGGEGQGYFSLHSAVVLATLKVDDRHVAVVFDGNDTLRHREMGLVREWALKHKGSDDLTKLDLGKRDSKDREAIDLHLKKELGPSASIDQLFISLKDIDTTSDKAEKMLEAIQDATVVDMMVPMEDHRNEVAFYPAVQATGPLLRPEVEQALRTEIQKDPSQVEGTPPKAPTKTDAA